MNMTSLPSGLPITGAARLFMAAAFASTLSFGLVACSGDTGGGSAGDETFDGTSFDPADAGRVELSVNDTSLQVGETIGFFVRALDRNGQPVPTIQVTCDTEAGLALIEPSDGKQLTDGGGIMSGRVGCAQPGSYRMGCRLPVGAGIRNFVTVTCSGTIPAGFNGFPGAGGGGLGGGSVNNPPSDNDVNLVSVALFDSGTRSGDFGSGTSDLQVDVIRNVCGTAAPFTPEPFFDSVVGLDVENFLPESVNFSRMRYVVSNSDAAGTPFTSAEFALINSDEIPGRNVTTGVPGRKRFLAFFTKAGGAPGGDKALLGASSSLPFQDWVSDVNFRVIGVSASGREISAPLRVSIAFGQYSRCGR